MASLFSSLFKRAPQVPAHAIHFPYTAESNPFRAKRPWPPDFAKLSQKHQFRLERRYRRRTKLKWARPNWVKATKLTQWGTIVFVLVYGTLYLDMGQGETAFDGVRRWYNEQMGDFGNAREHGRGGRDGRSTEGGLTRGRKQEG